MIHWVYSYKNARKKRKTRNGGDLPRGKFFFSSLEIKIKHTQTKPEDK
jgi:hypothetical protein